MVLVISATAGSRRCVFLYSLASVLDSPRVKEKHLPVPGLQDSLLTRDGKLTIKFARPKEFEGSCFNVPGTDPPLADRSRGGLAFRICFITGLI